MENIMISFLKNTFGKGLYNNLEIVYPLYKGCASDCTKFL